MFNLKKFTFCFLKVFFSLLCLLTLEFPHILAYQVTAPDDYGEPHRFLVWQWKRESEEWELSLNHGDELTHRDWVCLSLSGDESFYGTHYDMISPGGTLSINSKPTNLLSSYPAAVNADLYIEPPDNVLAVGGWSASEVQKNFRFCACDLSDYVNLQAVGRDAFENISNATTGIREITVPRNCSQIEENAWKDCIFIKKVTFLCPSITYLSPDAFNGCYDSIDEIKIACKYKSEDEFFNALNAGSYTTGDNSVLAFVKSCTDNHGWNAIYESNEDPSTGRKGFIILRPSKILRPSNILKLDRNHDQQIKQKHNGEYQPAFKQPLLSLKLLMILFKFIIYKVLINYLHFCQQF